MKPEWESRLRHWIATLEKEFYEPLGSIPMEGFCTKEMLSPGEALQQKYAAMPVGMPWGQTWEYCWLKGQIRLDERAVGQRIVMDIRCGGEATLFVNGQVFGTRRAEWVKQPHHYICDQILTLNGQSGECFDLLLEAYAGHDFPESPVDSCATGPVRGETEDYQPRPEHETRQVIGNSTYGIWHEEAYQLWLDVVSLQGLLTVLDPDSLRYANIEAALEKFTLAVDFEQPREARLQDYLAARAMLSPVMAAHNGSTTPVMSAVGNAHLDMCWLWPWRQTQRKIARTFAQQVRLMELYPEYKYIQSQPQAYLECKRLYPELYEKIREKVATGQWIADGGMWVEPDTNMSGGEALIRQLLYGKRFYQEEFGVDCQLLWLPDTFGYSAVLPQILRGCGVKYLTTQKIFWTYNGSDRFPYNYFTWQGMDGTEITSFLHMQYESPTDTATVYKRWQERVQKRDLNMFMLPFGYGDGGGGPCRDHIEFVLREKDLEGLPKVKMQSPRECFEELLAEGEPVNKYVGELYFQCHRGTYTSQAAVKRGNRRCEAAMRQAEMWCSVSGLPYPRQQLEENWIRVLENQFHDILPGSSIARVYEDARAKHGLVLHQAELLAVNAARSIAGSGEGKVWFNSLSWPRHALVHTENGYGFVDIPACGWSSAVNYEMPAHPVKMTHNRQEVTLSNGLITVSINALGEVVSCRDGNDWERIRGAGNVLHLYKDVPRKFDAWDIDSMYALSPVELEQHGSIAILSEDPFFAEVEVQRKIGASAWVQRISLKADSCQVDFHTKVNWQEQHRLLKVVFPTGIHTEEGINEIQFGYVKRPTHRSRPYDADRFEVCNHRYTALCDENRGAAVLNDCKYGVSMLGDEIGLTLLRAATCPDLHADRGEHEFTYSYTFWDGTFAEAPVVRQGYELNVQPLCVAGKAETTGLLTIDRSNIILESLKQAEDGSGDLILRLYESKHAACDVVLQLNRAPGRVYECDMLENSMQELGCESGKVDLAFRAFEIKTLRVHP